MSSRPNGRALKQPMLMDRLAQLEHQQNPALVEHAKKRAESVQNRIADAITAFSGSMWFVYIHIIWFSCWIGLASRSIPTASSR